MVVVIPFYDTHFVESGKAEGHCQYSFYIYPTGAYQDQFHSDLPIFLTIALALVMLSMLLTFLMYDYFVWRRNDKVAGVAARSEAIVASMFPSNVRDRLFENTANSHSTPGTKSRLKRFLSDGVEFGSDENGVLGDGPAFLRTKPIADLFPATTILFADISGFTAWSSTREPSQVR
jgi:hypothetical protein